jgi:DNA-binding XRE family transcriptional regulator
MTKLIENTNGYYSVSDTGTVVRLTKTNNSEPGRILKNSKDKGRPYFRVNLSIDGSNTKRFVHNLVLEAFVGPRPTKYHQCAHNDGNPANNSVSNLRWALPVENIHDKWRHNTMAHGENQGLSKLTDADVIKIFNLRRGGKSQRTVAKLFGVCKTTVANIEHGKIWRHIGLKNKQSAVVNAIQL